MFTQNNLDVLRSKTWFLLDIFQESVVEVIGILASLFHGLFNGCFWFPKKVGSVACNPPEGKDYKWYISGIYCQLGDYMPPTTFYGKQKQPLIYLSNTLPETNGLPQKIGRDTKGKDRIPTIHFQVLC